MAEIVRWSHDLDLVPVAGSASQSRRFVARHLLEHGLDGLSDDVCLVVSELVTNAVQHAHTPCQVVLEGGDTSVRLVVTDGSKKAPRTQSPSVEATHGRGLWMVDHVSTSWGVAHPDVDTKSVWARFDVVPAR